MRSTPSDLVGTSIAGHRIERVLGQGGMGTVYYGVQPFLDRPVAVKVLAPEFARDAALVRRFEREGQVLARLEHPNIARIHDMTHTGDALVLIMEFVEGVSLEERLDREGPLTSLEAARIFVQVARALEAAWVQGVVHRDVKPGNFMLTPGGIVKLVDFGLAGNMESSGAYVQTGHVYGSVWYMSPEHADGEALDVRSDLYSLGMSLWEALQGAPPFDGDDQLAVMQQQRFDPLPSPGRPMDPVLHQLIVDLTQKLPDDRPATPMEVSVRLEAFLADQAEATWALIVEPDVVRRTSLAALCRAAGLDAVTVITGEDAVAVLGVQTTAPAITITRLALPRLDGFGVLKALRSAPGGVGSGVILLSPFIALREAGEAEARRLGLRCVAGAPDDPEWVADALSAMLLGEVPSSPDEGAEAPVDEGRLARIDAMELVDEGAPDSVLQALVARTAAALGLPVALISLVLEDRQWFKAHTGLPPDLLAERGSPLEDAFCRHVVQARAPLVVNDAARDPFFAHNRLVQAGTVGSYAGAPVITPGGDVLGTLCVLDGQAHRFDRSATDALEVLARRVAGELHLRAPDDLQWQGSLDRVGLGRIQRVDELAAQTLGSSSRACLVFDARGRLLQANASAHALLQTFPGTLVGRSRATCVRRLDTIFAHSNLPARLRTPYEGPYAAWAEVDIGQAQWRLSWSAWPVRLDDGVVQFEVFRKAPWAGARDKAGRPGSERPTRRAPS